jgi:hypothetical protein
MLCFAGVAPLHDLRASVVAVASDRDPDLWPEPSHVGPARARPRSWRWRPAMLGSKRHPQLFGCLLVSAKSGPVRCANHRPVSSEPVSWSNPSSQCLGRNGRPGEHARPSARIDGLNAFRLNRIQKTTGVPSAAREFRRRFCACQQLE